MSIKIHRERLQRLLFMIRHRQFNYAVQAAEKLNCHKSTIERLLKRLRQEGYVIYYDKKLKKYLIEED